MATTRLDWYRSLDPAKREAIRELHRVNPWWNLIGPLFVLLWIVVAAAMLHADSWIVYMPGYFAIGTLIYGLGNILHEGIHGTLFRRKHWDRWCGFFMGLPTLFPFTAYRINHLRHHKYNRTERDPNEFANITTNRTLLAVFFYIWIVLGMAISWLRLFYIANQYATPTERRRIAIEYVSLLTVLAIVLGIAWRYGCLAEVGHVWLVPLVVASFLGNIRGWSEHALTQPGNLLTESRTVSSNWLFSLLNLNQNYHLEHHLFSGVPWYNLPRVHRLLRDEFITAGTSIYPSYTRFLWDAFRAGTGHLASRD